jgi:hypothetical protein
MNYPRHSDVDFDYWYCEGERQSSRTKTQNEHRWVISWHSSDTVIFKTVFGIWISNSVHIWFFIGFWCDQYNWFVWWQHHVYWFQKNFRIISMNFILYVNLNGQNLDGLKYPIGHMLGFSKSKTCTQFHIS